MRSSFNDIMCQRPLGVSSCGYETGVHHSQGGVAQSSERSSKQTLLSCHLWRGLVDDYYFSALYMKIDDARHNGYNRINVICLCQILRKLYKVEL